MRPLVTAVLLHDQAQGRHYDWLIEQPTDQQGTEPLVCFRCPMPPWQWPGRGEQALEELSAHRRLYLDYEGPLSGGRGTVTRVDRGTARVLHWDGQGARLELDLERHGRLAVKLTRTGNGWTGSALELGTACG